MSDYNLFESINRNVKRVSESVLDANALLLDSIGDYFIPPFISRPNDAGMHAEEIYEEAMISMMHQDYEEAEHQFARGAYFCSLFPRLASTRVEVASHEGMEALKRKDNPKETFETVRLLHGPNRDQQRWTIYSPKNDPLRR